MISHLSLNERFMTEKLVIILDGEYFHLYKSKVIK